MPDWSYQTVIKPALLLLPPVRARDLTLLAIGTLARTPFGPRVIAFLGHMDSPPGIARQLMGMEFAGPVGLGAGLDPALRGLHALARFGFGFLEAGPVTIAPVGQRPIKRIGAHGFRYDDPLANPGIDVVAPRLARLDRRVRVGVRIASMPDAEAHVAAEELCRLAERVAPLVDYLAVHPPPAWLMANEASKAAQPGGPREASRAVSSSFAADLRRIVEGAVTAKPGLPVLVVVSPATPARDLDNLLRWAADAGVDGAVVAGGVPEKAGGGRVVGATTRAASLATVRSIRATWGDRFAIIASGGVIEPRDALAALEYGADLVQLHSGLVLSGPGLPKRINEALMWSVAQTTTGVARARKSNGKPSETGPENSISQGRQFWLGYLLLGASKVIAGILVAAVALTAVVLPYDLAFLGIDRVTLSGINPRMMAFLSHDRLTLAGTMLSIGVLYLGLTWFGIRKGVHWARQSFNLSTTVGFATFFLFLAFGYFDILHAVLAVILLAFFLVGLRWRATGPPEVPVPDLDNDRAWRLGVIGQFVFVLIGVGIIVGGATIAAMGSTSVLVPADLEFLDTTAAALRSVNPRLIPLIAHDRAGFGGALVADALAVLTIALWGFRRGARWVWWVLLLAAIPGVAATVAIHAAVGYSDLWHLAPVLLTAILTAFGLALSQPFLWAKPTSQSPRSM